ncbi:bifunctional lysylphosphatidylglycerol flippase/synthetase MprF [Dietzia sp. PP-33]|jgi:phosphatidylglycerol lysyltransferase|uniref:bifunctional lysylphosphatidylglycerol flippase/synthetase MprF n=1 Tax=Dietzia sp. PP-33 TaxID=2957500 RepID=UPI0029A14353|nr:phosphatidylglycerol lysyltransferase domain-containing protein [Dietzia sp. PP-33]MDX2358329.1 phosphatidylglycerol lysyltransferase domain-containing protein [Dietzia sp. PP-33]
MSTEQIAEKTDEPGEPSPLATAAGTVARAARRLPVTAIVLAALLVTGVVFETLWRAAHSAPWFEGVAYGVPALEGGRWWTVFAGPWFGMTPLQHVSLLVLVAVGIGVGEWRLGSARTALVAIGGQLIGVLGAFGVLVPGDAVGWEWATELSVVLDVGCSTAVIAVLAATTATLVSPWRLRARAVLYGYVIVSFLFLGRLADLTHLIAFAVFLLIGERFFSRTERGLRPRTRRETRLVVSAGMWFLAAVHVVVYFVPADGPLGPTEADDVSLAGMLLSVLIAAVTAELLRRGYRAAWLVALVYALLTAVVTLVVTVLVVAADFESLGAVTAGTGLLWVGEAVLLVAGRGAFGVRIRRRVTGSSVHSDDVIDRVRALIRRHGGSTMSWMITWQPMNYFFGPGGDDTDGSASGVVGYRLHVGTVVALADPVAAPGDRARLLAEFVEFAEAQAAVPCLFSVSGETAETMRGHGWRALQIAEDTIMDLPDLAFAGKKWQKIRSAMNKADKGGTSFVSGLLREQPAAVLGQVREISEQWVGDKELPEMGFTLGTVEEALDDDVRIALAVDSDGVVQAALSWLPVYRGGPDGGVRGWTLDVMRKRNGPGANNMVEFLIARSALEFKDEGADFVSLSGAPLARSGDDDEVAVLDRGLDLLGQALEPYYGFRSLHHFKSKFNPRIEPVYLCFRDEADLPRIGVAIGRAYLPGATTRQLAALARSGTSETVDA